jgi:hypothetical protein
MPAPRPGDFRILPEKPRRGSFGKPSSSLARTGGCDIEAYQMSCRLRRYCGEAQGREAAHRKKESTMRSSSMLPLAALLLLAACTTPQQRAAQKQAEMEQDMMVYGPACARLGYPPASDQWRGCILNLSTKDQMNYGPYPYYPWGYSHGGAWGPYW